MDNLTRKTKQQKYKKREQESQEPNQTKKVNIPKPPPIFVSNITNIKNLNETIKKTLNNNNTEVKYKAMMNNLIEITVDEIENYKLIKEASTRCEISFYTYQVKSEKSLRAVIRHIY